MKLIVTNEGKTEFLAPVLDDSGSFPPGTAPVFYNKRMKLNRDATVMVVKCLMPESYLDAMGATGIRGLRVANECQVPVTINDYSSVAADLIRKNVSSLNLEAEVTNRDANALMSERKFGAVDLDPFGTPAPFVDAAAKSAYRYLFVTATDTAPLCGAHKKAGVRRYFANPVNTDYHGEVGLRILLGFVAREVVKYDKGLTPLFCFAHQHFVRLHLDVLNGADAADKTLARLGYVYQCPHCQYRTEKAGMLAEAVFCPECECSLTPVGPLWLGSVRSDELLEKMNILADSGDVSISAPLKRLIRICKSEIDTSTHYDYHRLAKEARVSPSSIDLVIADLQKKGYEACRTHYSGTGIKTTAPLKEIFESLTVR